MFKINLEKELNKEREKNISPDTFVKEVKLLMEAENTKEKDTLTRIGLGFNFKDAEKLKGINLERTTFEEKYKGKVFTTSEIEEICIKYDLRFLKSQKYNGHVDLQLGNVIAKFVDQHGLNLQNWDQDKFYIMAPATAFNLNKKPKPAPADPVIFYKVDSARHEEDKYVFVHKWGNDFTIMRYLRGLFREHKGTILVYHSIVAFFLISTIFSYLMVDSLINSFGYTVIAVMSVICAAIYVAGIKYPSDNFWDSDTGSQGHWNSSEHECNF